MAAAEAEQEMRFVLRKQREPTKRAKASDLPKPSTPDPGISEHRGAIDHGQKDKKNR